MSALFKTVKSFVASDDSTHKTLDDWKARELSLRLGLVDNSDLSLSADAQALNIVANADKVIAILRQRERKPRTPAAKPAKAKRTRKPKAPVAEATVAA